MRIKWDIVICSPRLHRSPTDPRDALRQTYRAVHKGIYAQCDKQPTVVSRIKLTILSTCRACETFLSPESETNFQKEVRLFLKIPECRDSTVQERWIEASVPKPACDRQTEWQTYDDDSKYRTSIERRAGIKAMMKWRIYFRYSELLISLMSRSPKCLISGYCLATIMCR